MVCGQNTGMAGMATVAIKLTACDEEVRALVSSEWQIRWRSSKTSKCRKHRRLRPIPKYKSFFGLPCPRLSVGIFDQSAESASKKDLFVSTFSFSATGSCAPSRGLM